VNIYGFMFSLKKLSRGTIMLGLGDFWVLLVYVLCILSALLCAVYGIIKWNSDGDADGPEQQQWVEEEIKIEKTL